MSINCADSEENTVYYWFEHNVVWYTLYHIYLLPVIVVACATFNL